MAYRAVRRSIISTSQPATDKKSTLTQAANAKSHWLLAVALGTDPTNRLASQY
jgi:hypothetical protein